MRRAQVDDLGRVDLLVTTAIEQLEQVLLARLSERKAVQRQVALQPVIARAVETQRVRVDVSVDLCVPLVDPERYEVAPVLGRLVRSVVGGLPPIVLS